MSHRCPLLLLGELAIRQLQDEVQRDRHFIDEDVPNPSDCPLSNPQSRREAINV